MENNKEASRVVKDNVRTLLDIRHKAESNKSSQHRIATAITGFAGSMNFVYLHVLVFAVWITVNVVKVNGFPSFDPFPFPLLTLVATTEAIFLAIFILMSQNSFAVLEKKREELEIQISLLTEHEVTRLIALVDKIATHLNISYDNQEISRLKEHTHPDKVLQIIENEMDSSKR